VRHPPAQVATPGQLAACLLPRRTGHQTDFLNRGRRFRFLIDSPRSESRPLLVGMAKGSTDRLAADSLAAVPQEKRIRGCEDCRSVGGRETPQRCDRLLELVHRERLGGLDPGASSWAFAKTRRQARAACLGRSERRRTTARSEAVRTAKAVLARLAVFAPSGQLPVPARGLGPVEAEAAGGAGTGQSIQRLARGNGPASRPPPCLSLTLTPSPSARPGSFALGLRVVPQSLSQSSSARRTLDAPDRPVLLEDHDSPHSVVAQSRFAVRLPILKRPSHRLPAFSRTGLTA
jgi:hypothetical protein